MTGLIPDRIVFASKVDVSRCLDVQGFIQAKAHYEAFREWCARENTMEILPVKDVPKRRSFKRWFTVCLP